MTSSNLKSSYFNKKLYLPQTVSGVKTVHNEMYKQFLLRCFQLLFSKFSQFAERLMIPIERET